MEGKQPDEEKNDPSKKEEEDPKKSRTRLNTAQRNTPLTKKQVRGLLGIVFFRQPLEPPGWPISPNRPPLPPPPCGLHGLPPIGWARSRASSGRAANCEFGAAVAQESTRLLPVQEIRHFLDLKGHFY
ncbi:hypothetical protein MRX96_004200 [Rhipicephalus microplus]